MSTFLGQADQFFVGIILIFGFIGVIRGFLKELTSIFNWMTTCYLTSLIKPFVLTYLNIEIPFFGDLVVNSILFVILIILVSVMSNLFISFFKEYVNGEINSILGLIFGCLKGYLIVLLILSFRNLLYKDKKDGVIFKNCKICLLTQKHQLETQQLLEILLGDFINKKGDGIDKIDTDKVEDNQEDNTKEDTIDELTKYTEILEENGAILNNNIESK